MLISRRTAIGSSVAVVLSAASVAALAQGDGFSRLPKDIQERMTKSREFAERMRNATTDEERNRVMAERSAWEQARAIENIKGQLGVSDEEWKVIQPRVEAVYNLLNPRPQFGGPDTRRTDPVEQRKDELHQVLNDKDASADQIKGKLTALRAAQVNANQELAKARQNLRQIMTLRQEATLVLNGLLD
jgi:hypothetical protein